jgi:hypothetical protein
VKLNAGATAVAERVHLCEIVVIRGGGACRQKPALEAIEAAAFVPHAEKPVKTSDNAASGRLPSHDGADISPATPTQRFVRT